VLGSASATPFGLRSSRTQHPQHQRPKAWAKTNRRNGPRQVAKLILIDHNLGKALTSASDTALL